MKIVISSSNKDKLKEFNEILGDDFEIITKDRVGLGDFEIEEDGETLAENSYKKSKSLYDKLKQNIFSDDTGLFVEALGGKPGVYAARYAGENCSYDDNVNKLLKELSHIDDIEKRKAEFKTVVCFISESGETYYAEGILEGYIGFEREGSNGFGYDSIFIAKENGKSLASLSINEKNKISHRRKAVENLKNILGNLL